MTTIDETFRLVPAQENDEGIVFVFTVVDAGGSPVDISDATEMNAIFRPGPKGATFSRAGSFVTDGTDGKFSYTTVPGDLTPAHEAWSRQGEIVTPSSTLRTEVRSFSVKPNL